jgi:hypothetical protein
MSTHVIGIQISNAGALALVSGAGSRVPKSSLCKLTGLTRASPLSPSFARVGRNHITGRRRAPDIAPSKLRS